MPSSKKEKKFKSLDSFIVKPKSSKKKRVPKKIPKKTKQEEENTPIEQVIDNKINEKERKLPIKPENKGIEKSEIKFYEPNDIPFGELIFDKKLTKNKGEAQKSLYLRYLIDNNKICQNMDQGLLLTVEYCGTQNKAYARFYDLSDEKIKFWIDTTGHEPYCLHREDKETLEKNQVLTGFYGYDRIESVNKIDLLKDKEIKISKIYAKTPSDIGQKGNKDNISGEYPETSIYNILHNIYIDNPELSGAWEAKIRYHHNFIFDRELIPGLIYRIKNGKLEQIEIAVQPEIENQFAKIYQDEKPEFQEMAKNYLKIFSNPIPDVKRIAFDIEVDSTKGGQLPNAKLAKQAVISVSFCSTDGTKKVLVLWREGIPVGKKHDDFPDEAEVIFFKKEIDLIKETFRIIWEYPVVLSFNGDNFDFYYLFHRAHNLKVPDSLNPIQIARGGGMVSNYAYLKSSIHVDLFQIFANRSLKGYAFGSVYDRNSLDEISAALLDTRKIKHESGEKFSAPDIANLDYSTLVYYNLMDSILTLDLTTFGGNTVWNLIIYLLRITKLPLQDMFRHQISFWIRSVIFYEHRVRNYLIPRQSELLKLKSGGFGKSDIKGKGFQGAYVIPPVPGVHFDVVVTDFSSLYPTIIKSRNLSYETVQCNHEECSSNNLPDTPYHVCKKRVGIFALVVGFLRDIRVKWFKPRSSDKSLNEEDRNFAKILQSALKVFVNGSYGVFGSPQFPLYCLPVAESTTAIGRFAIKSTIEKAESLGIKVLYGDTDSVFLANPSEKQINEIIQWSTDELGIDLEKEKTYQFLALSKRKKNYVGIYKDSLFVDIKGMTGKKRNTPPFIKQAFQNVTNILKKIENIDDFNKSKKKIIDRVKSNLKKIGISPDSGGFQLKDYTISMGLKKNLKEYKKNIPQHVKSAKIEQQSMENVKYVQGDTIKFIKAKNKDGVKPLSMAKIQDINIKKYKQLLENTFEQLLDALDISLEELKGAKKLDSFF